MRTSTRTRRLAAVVLSVTVTAAALVGVGATSASAGPPVRAPRLSIFAGTGNQGTPTPGPIAGADFARPVAITLDTSGNTYIADAGNKQVYKVTPGGILSIVAGTGTWGPATPGPATSADLGQPAALAVDSSGNVFISDFDFNMIYKVTPDGTLSIFAGTGEYGTLTAGPATASAMYGPWGLAIDSSDNLYAAVENNFSVVKITSGGTLSVVAGTGASGPTSPGPATSADLGAPAGLTLDTSGNLYITDAVNRQVYKVTTDGTLSIIAGTGNFRYDPYTPGTATSSDLGYVYGVLVDATGNIYLSDSYNFQVIKITPAGDLTVVAGTGNRGPDDEGGFPTSGNALQSDMGDIRAIAFDLSGNILVADRGMRVVEKIRFAQEGVAWEPDAPTGLSATAGYQSTTIAFTPGDDGGSPITKYQYKVGAGPWTDTVGTTSPITVTGLTNYTTPPVILRAVNAVGTSPASSSVAARPRNRGPVLNTATAMSRNVIRAEFSGITFGGVNVKGYTVNAYRFGTNTIAGSCQVAAAGRSCDIKGLVRNTRYDVRVINYFRFLTSRSMPRETLWSNTITVRTAS